MQVVLKGKNVEITDWLRQYVEKKVDKLDRYLPEIQEAGNSKGLQQSAPRGSPVVHLAPVILEEKTGSDSTGTANGRATRVS